MSDIRKTATYKTITDSGGNRYRFFCELFGMEVCVTKPVKADDPEDELMLARKRGGKEFLTAATNATVGFQTPCLMWILQAAPKRLPTGGRSSRSQPPLQNG